MSDVKSYFSRLTSGAQGTEEERACAAILFNDQDVRMGDHRLNNLAAMTYNSKSCEGIFNLLEKAISPTDNPWKTIYKALLLLHTIVLYGSELAIDKSISLCKFVHPLQTYNSALVKKGFFGSGGTDYGAPVRATASTVASILMKDEHIRRARAEARSGANTLVPVGEIAEQQNPQAGLSMSYGQGLTSSVGAGYSLEAVPGMYEGRPDRYFDNENDIRNRNTAGNHQITRDAMAPSLLDLVFDSAPTPTPQLPPAEYLPSLQRQQELERQLAEQQEILRRLQEQQKLNPPAQPAAYPPQQSYAPALAPAPAAPTMPAAQSPFDLLSTPMMQPSYPPQPSFPSYLPSPAMPHNSTMGAYPPMMGGMAMNAPPMMGNVMGGMGGMAMPPRPAPQMNPPMSYAPYSAPMGSQPPSYPSPMPNQQYVPAPYYPQQHMAPPPIPPAAPPSDLLDLPPVPPPLPPTQPPF